jgi:hypothetical protein
VYLPAQNSCRKPAVTYLLAQSFVTKISAACLPIQPLLPEAALAFSVEMESPPGKQSEPLVLEGWSGLSIGSADTVGSFQWRMYWPGLSSRKASVAYLMALPLAWGLVWRIDWQRTFCQKGVVGWVRPRVSMQAHNHFSFQKDNRIGPKGHTVSHSYCFVVGLPGETATKHEANHSPPSSAEIKSASSYTSTLHLPVWRGA